MNFRVAIFIEARREINQAVPENLLTGLNQPFVIVIVAGNEDTVYWSRAALD
jgi:hypothetical protein